MKSFDTYMAEVGQQSTLDQLRKDMKYDEAKRQYEQQGYYGSGGKQSSSGGYGTTQGSSVNFNSILDQVKSSLSGVLDPIVAQIKGQAPAISQAYGQAKTTLEGQKSSLADKYQKLLSDITNAGTQQTNTATRVTNSELARRGITGDSTAAGQEMQTVLNPIQDKVLAAKNQAVIGQGEEENSIANAIAQLALNEQSAQGGLLQQVAQLLSGGAQTATQTASNIYSQLLSGEQGQYQSPAQQLYADLQNQVLQKQVNAPDYANYLTLSEGQTILDPITGKVIYKAPKTYSSGGGSDWS